MKTKNYLLAAVALMLAACSSDEIANEVAPPDAISFSATIGEQATTRTLFIPSGETATNLQDTYFATGREIKVYKTVGTEDPTSAIYTTADHEGTKNAFNLKDGETPLTWPTDETATVGLQAFHPSSYTGSATEGSFTVSNAQGDITNFYNSDLMFSNALSTTKTTTTQAFTFAHKLSKVIVNLTRGAGFTDAEWQAATVAISAKLKATIATENNTTTITAASTDNDPADIAMGTVGETTATTVNFAAIIVPQDITLAASTGTYDLIKISIANKSLPYTLKNTTTSETTKSFESGKKYTYNLTVSMAGIKLQSTEITNWTEGNTTTEQANQDILI